MERACEPLREVLLCTPASKHCCEGESWVELLLSQTVFLLELLAPCGATSWTWHGLHHINRLTDKGRE